MSASAQGSGSGGGGRGFSLPLKLGPASRHEASSSPPQQPQSPHSPKNRLRRGQPQMAVLIDPPSLEDNVSGAAAAPAAAAATYRRTDSLSLAFEELHAGGGPAAATANFLAAHERASRCSGGGGGSGASSLADTDPDSTGDLLSVRPAAKRSSSLKSKKTPPGTPSQVKKAVRFADAFGLDLANVKHVLDPDNPPEIPAQATRDLKLELGDDDDAVDEFFGRNLEASAPVPVASASCQAVAARPAFSQPGHSAGFGARVLAQKVVLESAIFAPPAEIRGYIRVANLAFEKSVTVRATYDSWRSSVEVSAVYVPNSGSGMTDQFVFSLTLPGHLLLPQSSGSGSRVVFCIAYSACGQTYWDNNFGDNYAFDCVPVGDAWGRGF